MINKLIPIKAEEILLQVANVTDNLSKRAQRVDFEVDKLSPDNITDLRTYLGYTKSFSDLAKVRLLYYKAENMLPKKNGKEV